MEKTSPRAGTGILTTSASGDSLGNDRGSIRSRSGEGMRGCGDEGHGDAGIWGEGDLTQHHDPSPYGSTQGYGKLCYGSSWVLGGGHRAVSSPPTPQKSPAWGCWMQTYLPSCAGASRYSSKSNAPVTESGISPAPWLHPCTRAMLPPSAHEDKASSCEEGEHHPRADGGTPPGCCPQPHLAAPAPCPCSQQTSAAASRCRCSPRFA